MAKRKPKLILKPLGPQEYKEWKVGQKVYCIRHPDDKFGYGKITMIHLEDTSGDPCFTYMCEVCGQYRLAMFSKIIDKPTKAQVNKAGRGIK